MRKFLFCFYMCMCLCSVAMASAPAEEWELSNVEVEGKPVTVFWEDPDYMPQVVVWK